MTNPCQLTTRAPFLTTDSSPRFHFPMLITWVTTVSSSSSDDNVVIKISHGIVVNMTTKIFTVQISCSTAADGNVNVRYVILLLGLQHKSLGISSAVSFYSVGVDLSGRGWVCCSARPRGRSALHLLVAWLGAHPRE